MSNDLEQIKKKANVPAIIGMRIALKEEKGRYVARCPFHEERTPSWGLDNKQGQWLWHCFGCGKGGDVISFIEMFDHCTPAEAIEKLKATVENKEWQDEAEKIQKTFKPIESSKPKTTYTLEQWQRGVQALRNSPQGLAWLKEIRGLSEETIAALQLGYAQKHVYRIKEELEACREQGWIMFPRIENGKVVAVKFRSITEKCFSQVNNMDARALFNIETINPLEPVYVTEGELDACILEQAGFRAVSCPSAGVDISTESRVKLKLAERIFLAGDNDGGVGNEYMKKLHRELGENTHLLVWPDGKDANDFFRDACNRDVSEFAKRVKALSKKAKDAPPEGFRSILERLTEIEGTDLGADPNRLHFPAELDHVDKMTYTPRGGVVVIYSTYSGTGKSMFKTQILTEEAKRGEVVADLSPEIRDDEYLSLVTSQQVGPEIGGLRRTGKMDRKHFQRAAELLESAAKQRGVDFRYYVGHDVLGQSEEEVLSFLENTIRTLGATRFAIDTFHRLIFAEGKNQVQAEGSMIKKIEAIGNKYGTIFILICQSNAEAEGIDNLKKDEHGVLRGSREIRDVPAAIYLLHRKRRQQKNDDPDDILELETGLFAKKTRFKGPGKPQVHLLLKEENSLFVELASPAQQQSEPAREDHGSHDIGEQEIY